MWPNQNWNLAQIQTFHRKINKKLGKNELVVLTFHLKETKFILKTRKNKNKNPENTKRENRRENRKGEL